MGVTAATIAGLRVTSGRVYLPAWGAWSADLSVDGEHTLAGAVTIVVNDLTLKGTVLSGGPAFGRSEFRVVAGAGGWGRVLPKKSYANDAGVKAATVLGDAAREAGETLDAATVPATRVGPSWTRRTDPASRVLEQLYPSGWYVDEAGITRIGRRPAKTYTGQGVRVTPVDRARRRVTLAAEVIATLLPGAIVDGIEAIDVVHEITPKSLRTMIYGKDGIGSTSQYLDALRALVDQLDPDRVYRGTYEYRVVALEGKRLNLQPVLVSTGVPDLQRVPLRPGVAGAYPTCALGSRVLVTWINADPARPAVVGFEDPDGEGFVPTLLEFCGGADFVALAGKVASELASVSQALTTHVHSGVTTGPGASGPAAPVYTPSSVAASKVKAA